MSGTLHSPGQCPSCNATGQTQKFCNACGARLVNPAGAAAPTSARNPTQFLFAAEESALARPLARLVVIEQDGREGAVFSLHAQENVCGRRSGVIQFADDPLVSPVHCRFIIHGRQMTVQDAHSLNGVYVRLRGEIELQHGDMIRFGRQVFLYELPPPAPTWGVNDGTELLGSPHSGAHGQLAQLLDSGRRGNVHLIRQAELKIGRETGDILFPDDGFVSGSHCVVAVRGGRVFLGDLGSSNGTYIRVRAEKALRQDDLVLVGRKMLRVDLR